MGITIGSNELCQMRNFTMVGKKMGHPLDEIGRWKNRRYPTKSTWRYQIGEDSTKLDGTSTKNMWGKIYFSFYILFPNKGKLVILLLSFKGKNRIRQIFCSFFNVTFLCD